MSVLTEPESVTPESKALAPFADAGTSPMTKETVVTTNADTRIHVRERGTLRVAQVWSLLGVHLLGSRPNTQWLQSPAFNRLQSRDTWFAQTPQQDHRRSRLESPISRFNSTDLMGCPMAERYCRIRRVPTLQRSTLDASLCATFMRSALIGSEASVCLTETRGSGEQPCSHSRPRRGSNSPNSDFCSS